MPEAKVIGAYVKIAELLAKLDVQKTFMTTAESKVVAKKLADMGVDVGQKVVKEPLDPAADWTVTINESPLPNEPVYEVSLNNPGGNNVANFGVWNLDNGVPVELDSQALEDAASLFNSLAAEPASQSVADKLPAATKQAIDSEAATTALNNADGPAKQASQKIAKQQAKPELDAEGKKAIAKTKGLHDRARSSMEYHEWDYFVQKSGNWDLLHELGSDGIQYIFSTDAVTTPGGNFGPPYYQWIRFREIRDIAEAVKRYRRLRGGCGGKALWTEQGFASKIAAIKDDVTNDAAVQADITTIVAAGPSFFASA